MGYLTKVLPMTGLKPHTVEEIMTSPVVTVPASLPVEDALHLMREKKIHSVVVEPDRPGGVYGIMTQRDILRKVVAADRPLFNVTVSDLMSSPLITVSPDTTIKQCSIIMLDANIRRAVVMKGGRLVGIVSDTDIFQSVEERGWGPTRWVHPPALAHRRHERELPAMRNHPVCFAALGRVKPDMGAHGKLAVMIRPATCDP
jgi:isocitrate dehydrogenase